MKTLRFLLLVWICLLGNMGISAQNVDFDFKVDGLYYKIQSMENRTVSLVYEDKTHSGTFDIPGQVSFKGVDFAVESLGDYAFARNTKLTAVRFPESIKSVGQSAFSSCSNITSFTFTDSIKSFAYGAFQNCESLESVHLPEGIRDLPDWAFSGCKALRHVVLPESLTVLGDCAFNGCKVLQNVQLPEKLEVLGVNAFDGCSGLTEMRFPQTLKRIESGVFQSCENLATLVFPDSLEYIGYATFHSCHSLTEVVLPSTLSVIEDNVFYNCSGLKKVVLPESLTRMSRHFFYNCTHLESVTLPEQLTYIDDAAFKGCSSLKTIEIPKKVYSIGDEAFWNCSSLSTIKVYASNPPSVEVRTFDLLNYSDATLYVPKGVRSAYQSKPGWKDFRNMVEMKEAPVETYPLMVYVGRGGSLSFDNNTIRDQYRDVDVVAGKVLVLKVTPDAGYKIKSVICNNKDITDQLVEDGFTLNMTAAASVSVSFEKLPVDLVIRQADSGCSRLHNAEGRRYSFSFEPAPGWRLNTVMFNGEDVTWRLDDYQQYTTPVINSSSELNVSFELDDISAVNEVENSPFTVGGYRGEIVVKGATEGTGIVVYTVDGAKVAETVAKGGTVKITLNEHQVYVVKVGQRTFKLAL